MVKVKLKKDTYVVVNDGSPAKVYEAGEHEFDDSVASNLVRCGQAQYVTEEAKQTTTKKK